jgi:uncharacterized protein (TIGR00288 family)
MNDSARVAVLVDCDNISHQWTRQILAETAKHGTLSIRRGYGDWTSDHLKGWREKLPAYAIQPVQQFAYTVGKNSTDFSLVIDAMDLLYSGNVEAFVIVSSDGDFTRLAMRLRESGKRVYGIGARKTPQAFQNACDRFTYVEVLVDDDTVEGPAQPVKAVAGAAARTAATSPTKAAAKRSATPTKQQRLRELAELFLPAVEASAKEDGWASLSEVGQYVVNTNPTFDSRNHGYAKLSTLVRDLPQLEVNEVATGNGRTTLFVRAAPTARPRKRTTRRPLAVRAASADDGSTTEGSHR